MADPAPAANRYSPAWFSLFLDAVPDDRIAREAGFVDGFLPPRSRILDLPCGAARHARHLATLGHDVLAVDRSEAVLRGGEPAAAGVRKVCADMRALPLRAGRLDAVVCLWQSFGYFGDAENEGMLREWSVLVRPGGLLVLDLYHRGFFERHEGERTFERAGIRVRERRVMEAGRLLVELSYGEEGAGDRFDWRVYAPDELRELALRCGWERIAACRDFDPDREPSESAPRAQHVFRRGDASPRLTRARTRSGG